MHKFLYWIRNLPEDDQTNHRRWSIKRWKSSEKLKTSKWPSRQHSQKNSGRNTGDDGCIKFSEHFDAVACASTSSPSNLASLGTANGQYIIKFSNGIDKSVDRSRHCKAAKNHKPLSASMKHREPKNVKKKRGTEAATTESISDTYNCLALDMKSRSANEMSQTKRPSFLQRIRLRLSSKSGTVQQEKLNQMDQHVFNELSFPLQRLAGEELSREKRPVIQQNGQKHLLLKKQKYEIMQAESKPEALQYQEADAISQGRCSSFDYFSATASPTDQTLLSNDYDDTERKKLGATSSSHRISEVYQKHPIKEEEKRFATASEARAYLRRQIASENSESKVHFEGETEEEEAAFDADDEISNRLTTSSTINDSIYQLQRPNSSMSTSGTGPHHQRESIYFTVVQPLPNHLSPPSTSPPERRSLAAKNDCNSSPLIGDAYVVDDEKNVITKNNAKRSQDKHKNQQPPISIQRSKSQQLFNRLMPSTAGLLPDVAADLNENDFPPTMQGSEPNSVKVSRRRLRFVIPQVSICSVEDRSSIGPLQSECNNQQQSIDPLNNNQNTSQQKVTSSAYPSESTTSAASVLPPYLPQMLGGIGVAPGAEEELKRALTEMDRKEFTLAQRRQSNLDVVHQASGRRTSTTLIPLTPAQIHLIRSLWRQVYLSKGPTVIGSQISHRLFFKEPSIREQFRRCPLPHQYVNHDSFSKAHCRHISELVDQIVESLDDLEIVGALLERIGRAHARIISGGQLSSKLWNSVAETFIDCTLEWGDRRARSETVRKAWALIIAFMIERIKYGHLEERRQITAIRSTIASLERFTVGSGEGNSCSGKSTISASGTPLSTPIALQREQGASSNATHINCSNFDVSRLPVPMIPTRRVSASTALTSSVKIKPSSMSSNSIGEVVLSSIASPIASRRKVAISIPQSPKAQQSPVKTRTKVLTSRSAGQERRSDKAEKHEEKLSAGIFKHTNV